jgi:hypothetical protein
VGDVWVCSGCSGKHGPGNAPHLAPRGYHGGTGSGSISNMPVELINVYEVRPTGKASPMRFTGWPATSRSWMNLANALSARLPAGHTSSFSFGNIA